MKLLTPILLLLGAFFVIALATPNIQAAFEGPFDEICRNDPEATVCQDATKNQDIEGDNSLLGPNGIITKAVSIINIVIGAAAVIMIIIGGLKYVLSNGDSNNVNSAKNTILWAVVGLAVAGVSQVIVAFIVSKL